MKQVLLSCLTLLLVSCSKDFLTTPPSSNIIQITNLTQIRGLLNNDFLCYTPSFGELSTTDYYVSNDAWLSASSLEQNAYVWKKDFLFPDNTMEDWNASYKTVLYANVTLEALGKINMDRDNAVEWKKLKGTALFLRGYSFFNLAQIFSLAYDKVTSNTDLGISLRLVSDIHDIPPRSSVTAAYAQILKDLKEAKDLLPTDIDFNERNHPCRPAAMALLSRVYLSMRDYTNAGLYADSCLQLYKVLIDYNTVDFSSSFPFKLLNTETMYQSYFYEPLLGKLRVQYMNQNCMVDSNLYNTYQTNDLRRSVFFVQGAGYAYTRCDYSAAYTRFFSGLAIDEVYLMRAECYARTGDKDAAMADLNTLLMNRWKTGSFIPYTATSAADALTKVLLERRKELCFRGLRWMDIKRLNKEGAGITLVRAISGQDFVLPPNSPRYALPLAPDVIEYNGFPQNPR